MSEATFTPGPWRTYCNDHRGYRLGVMISSGDDRFGGNENLCDVHDPMRFEGGVTEAEANARVLASAPDGFALAEAILEAIGEGGELNTRTSDYGLADLRDMAAALVARVTAEEVDA